MKATEETPIIFEATRQFVISPDQRYQVELRDDSLCFTKTGSQFDSKWVARGAKSVLGDKRASRLEQLSPKALLSWGIAFSSLSALLLLILGILSTQKTVLVRRKNFLGIGLLVFGFIFGLIMIIGGLSSRGKRGDRQAFELRMSQIIKSAVLPPQSELARRGEPQVARIEIRLLNGKRVKLSIPSESDLEIAKAIVPKLC